MTVCGETVTGVCVAGKCPYFKRCCPIVWDKYGRIKPQTNEEWFNNLHTEEKAEALARGSCGLAVPYDAGEFTIAEIKRRWEKWLKQPHTKE